LNLTLHLTENCNMDCTYCVSDKVRRDMSEEIVDKACDMIFSSGKSAGFSFFGGEPLLRKDLIYRALDNCKAISERKGIPFNCKMTTNGILLDDEFLECAKAVNMGIGLSFDGLVQDRCRKMCGGAGSFAVVEKNARKLLKYLPKSYAMMTIAPEAADGIAESVRYLYELGFRRINCTIAYGSRVLWTDEAMEIVREQMLIVAEFFEECFEKDYFFFGPFSGKISEAIHQNNPKERCHLGTRQAPVAVDGKIYACTQFIGDEDYCLGDVFNGYDLEKMKRMALKNSERKEPEDCAECGIRDRCTHTCGCTNRMETGDADTVSAVTCNYEQMIIKIADEVGERLYEQYPEKFAKLFF